MVPRQTNFVRSQQQFVLARIYRRHPLKKVEHWSDLEESIVVQRVEGFGVPCAASGEDDNSEEGRFLFPGNIMVAKGFTVPDASLTAKLDTVISE